MKSFKLILKATTVVALGGLLMANQKCEKQQAPQARQLKKNVRVVGMHASSFLDNSGFSFSEVAQNQLSGVFFEDNSFFERNVYPNNIMRSTTSGVFQKTVVSDQSQVQLKQWFPQMKSTDVQLTKDSACLISRPQHYLYGKINSLEAYSGASLQFGFNQSMVQVPISGNIKLDKMRMDLSMHAFDPWTQQNMASVNVESFKKDYAVGFGIDLGIIHIGPQFYRTTGMAEVTLNGLKNAVKGIADKLKALQRQEWQTRVMVSRDNYVVIVGGAELGLKKGDQLKVENEVHDWIGEPCGDSSVLSGSTSVTHEPWIVEIEDAGNLMSKAKVLNVDENETIEVGALVRVHKFVEEVAAAPKPAK